MVKNALKLIVLRDYSRKDKYPIKDYLVLYFEDYSSI